MRLSRLSPLVLLVAAGPALAHPGHGHAGFLDGALHPLSGWDHLLAMLMVGLWSGLAFRRAAWAGPATFLAALLLGFRWGTAGAPLGLAELLIMASLAALGVAIWRRTRLPLAAALPVITLFAVGHGAAHGAEMPDGGLAFAAGMALSAVALLVAGLLAARHVPRTRPRFATAWTS
jgi:urease accessory protein